jgi:Icc-related predicted phosphoesterase
MFQSCAMKLFASRSKAETKVFFTTDVHGSERCFRKFLNAARAYKVDVLILGGDVAGKRVLPLVRKADGYRGSLDGREQLLTSDEELQTFERAAADAGLYAWRTDDEGVARVRRDGQAAVEAVFLELASERLRAWLSLAQERLDETGTRLFFNLGNDDPFELDKIVEDAAIAVFPEGRLVELDDRRVMASVGFANQTPWNCARDVPEDDLAARIDTAIANGDRDGRQLVLNLHCPPYDSGLDTAAVLSEDLAPITQGGHVALGPVGSTAVRAAIEQYEPVLSLHGHIHESRGVANIGPTIAINPGTEYPEGILRGALVTFDANGVASYVLTSG